MAVETVELMAETKVVQLDLPKADDSVSLKVLEKVGSLDLYSVAHLAEQMDI